MKAENNNNRCMAAVLLLALLLTATTAWAQTYTVTLTPGEGSGSDITISNADAANVATSLQTAGQGQFYQDGGNWWFRAPGCPFTAPNGKVFIGWDPYGGNNSVLSIGGRWQLSGDLTLTACWADDGDAKLLSLIPSEGTLIQSNTGVEGFSPDETRYDLIVTCAGPPVAVTLTAVPRDISATVIYDGSDDCPTLRDGNSVIIRVQNGGNKESYNVSVSVKYRITLTTDGGGTAKAYNYYNGEENYIGKKSQTFSLKATPADGWKFVEWQLVSGNGSLTNTNQQNNGCYIIDTDNAVIKAVFEPQASPVTLSDDADNSNVLASSDGTLCSVTLSERTLYIDSDWNTLCLPFALSDLTGTPLEGFTVMELDTEAGSYVHPTGLDDGTLYLNFKSAANIEAGKPYIVKKQEYATIAELTATNGTEGYNSYEGYASLVDGNTGTKWCSNTDHSGGSFWSCEFSTASPVNVTGYTLTTGGDTGNNPDRNPQKWTLEAKLNSGDAWTVIDSRDVTTNSGDALPGANTTAKIYNIDASEQGNYQYFRFTVSQTGGDLMQLAELTLQVTVNGITNPVFNGVTINAAAPTAVNSTDGKVSFVGSYDPVSIPGEDKSILFLGAANTLYYPDAAMTIGTCRAHFELNQGSGEAPVRAFMLCFGEDEDKVTAISFIPSSYPKDKESGDWYSLDGRRLSGKPAQKGIYINNGQKVYVK